MPRLPRIDLPGHYYHVMVRGNERRSIFRTDDDRADFLRRLRLGLANTHSACLTWALMTNHLHLLVLSGIRGLAALMQPLLTGYVGGFNRRYHRVGHLVQNRYKAILCQEDPYLLELLRYIPLNPVRAGLVKTPEELARYPWTGHHAILGKAALGWQSVDEVLGYFGEERSVAQSAYEAHVIDGWNLGRRAELEGGGLLRSLGGLGGVLQARRSGESQAYDPRILGNGEFVEKILRSVEESDRRRALLSTTGHTLESLQCLAAAVTGVTPDSLRQNSRCRPVTEARALFIFAVKEVLEGRLKDLKEWLGMSSGSLSEAYQRGGRLATQYGFMERIMNDKLSEIPRTVP